MQVQHRVLALAGAVVLLLAIVAADQPLTSSDPTTPAGSQTTEPMVNSEPVISGKSEASGESEIGSPMEQVTAGADPISIAAADRSQLGEGELLLDGEASNLGSFHLDPLPGDAQSGPAADATIHSHESQESEDHEVESEEALSSQGM